MCVLCIGAHLCCSLVDISELQHHENGRGRGRFLSGEARQLKSRRKTRVKRSATIAINTKSRTQDRKGRQTSARLRREITAENPHSDQGDIIEDSSEDANLVKSGASPQQITRNSIW